ncbi:MAG: sugar phosphate isomerase/epimerase [Spirochaetaceae bacterium]|nr:MAG: sugar phosphate isomerase/epimerase [Spirochaetaceae bacterium]
MIRGGVVSVTFRHLPTTRIIELAVDAGLAAIEWGGDVHVPHGDVAVAQAVGRRCEDNGVATPSYGSYYRLGTSAKEGLSFDAVLDTAEALGAGTVRIWAGNRASADVGNPDRLAMVEEARRIADDAERRDMIVAFEYHANTLTDTNDSAVALMEEIDHPAVRCYWQPRNGQPADYSVAGLESIAPWLGHLHVFHWIDSSQRYRLSEGHDAWTRYLAFAAGIPGDRYAFLEFVLNDSPDQFLEDAGTLSRWLSAASRTAGHG